MPHFLHDRKRVVNAKTWNTVDDPDNFPELHDNDYLIDHVQQNKDFGVCFSGGGTRSASCTLGQLRALKEIGLLDKIGYISAVSGGSWAATPFTYLPENQSDARFLGGYIPPEELSLSDLDYAPKGSLARAISKTVIGDDFFGNILAGDEAYSRAIGNLFLKPFDLDDTKKFFAFSDKDIQAVIKNNSQSQGTGYYLKEEDFYTTKPNRPYLIVAGTLLRLSNDDVKQRKLQIEYTPMYTGIRQHFPKAGRSWFFSKNKSPIGGGYVQSFVYDADAPEAVDKDKGLYEIELPRRNRFCLSDIIGSSGAAPEEILREAGFTFLGFPEFNHWSPKAAETGDLKREREYPHGDGGHLENFGIMPLLARQVKNIIVFINTPTPYKNPDRNKEFTDDLAPLFGREEQTREPRDIEKKAVNQVFEKEKLDALLLAFDTLQGKDKPLVHIDTYQVQENSHYLIRPYEAKICWVYNSPVKLWNNSLTDTDIKNLLDGIDENGGATRKFKNFPNYKTFLENSPNIIDLTARQVNMLAHFSAWCVVESARDIVRKLEV